MMELRPIPTKRDYDLALKVAEMLGDASVGTTNAGGLEVLTVLAPA